MLACFVVGTIFGLCMMGACWSNYERRSIRRGFMELDGKMYRLTRIGLYDFKEEE